MRADYRHALLSLQHRLGLLAVSPTPDVACFVGKLEIRPHFTGFGGAVHHFRRSVSWDHLWIPIRPSAVSWVGQQFSQRYTEIMTSTILSDGAFSQF